MVEERSTNMAKEQIVIRVDKIGQDILSHFLMKGGALSFCTFENPADMNDSVAVFARGVREFPYPVRLGKVIDYIMFLIKCSEKESSNILVYGAYSLDLDRSIFLYNKKEARLTEKEAALLECLFLRDGAVVSRQELLEYIWGYGENIETHTLETHIYRLRQKIEDDPSDPKILLTEENGYRTALVD